MSGSNASHRNRMLTVVLVMVIVLSLSGCTSFPGESDVEPITMTLASPFVEPRNTGTAMLHDATLDIMKLTPRNIKVKWSELWVLVKGADGSVILPQSPLVEDTGTYGGAVEVWFDDEAGDRKEADAGDSILITGMEAAEYEGGHIEIGRDGERIGATILPTDFP